MAKSIKFSVMETRLIVTMLLLTVLPAITIAWIAHDLLLDNIQTERMDDVGRVAEAKHTQLTMVLKRARERSELFLSYLANQCDAVGLNRACAERLMRSHLASEMVQGMTLHNEADGRNLSVGAVTLSSDAGKTFKPGQLAEFIGTGPEKNRAYFIRVADRRAGLKLVVVYPSTNLVPVFDRPGELGKSGEVFLSDGAGYFVTPPRYSSTQGRSHPIHAQPMRTCLSGESDQVLDLDYRDAKIIHGFNFVPEFGSACIMAHIDQQEAFAPLAALDRKISIALSIFILLFLAGAIAMAKRIAKPVIDLSNSARTALPENSQTKSGAWGQDEITELAATFSSMSKRLTASNQQLEQQAAELMNEKRLVRRVIDSDPNLIFINDAEGRILLANEAMATFFGKTVEEMIGKSMRELVDDPGQIAAFDLNYRRVIDTFDERASFDVLQIGHDKPRWFYTIRKPLVWNDCSAVLLTIAMDFTELKQAQEGQQKINRALRLLSVCNMVLAHAEEESQLLERICKLIVKTGGYRMAWIGYAQQDEDKSVHPAAQYGSANDYLKNTRITWADTEWGNGPTGLAIRTGIPQINQDFLTNPAMEKWRAEALKHGYHASIALPLRNGIKVFGALTIYSGEAGSFDTEEVKLLEELANNLAFGIVTHQLRDAHKQTEKELQQSEEKFRVLVEHLPQKIFLKDLDSTYLSCSENYAQDLGIEPEAIVGKTDFDFYPRALAERYRADDRRVMDSGKAEEMEEPYVVDGVDKFANTVKVPFRDKDGHIVGVLGVFWDITDRKHAEAELREKEERLALATAHNGVGIWDWNLQTNEMVWDDSMYVLYHIRREDFTGTEEAWRAALHPDDLERGDREVEDAILGIKPFDAEFRVIWPSGEIRHIKAVAKVFRDEQGHPVRMLGTNMDITERKMAEARRDQLSEAIKHSAEAIGLADKNNRFIYINPAYERLLGYSQEEVVGKSVDELIGIPEDELIQPKLAFETAEREGAFRGETTRRTKDGRNIAVSVSVSAVRDQFGRRTGYVANLFDLTERKKAEGELVRQRSFMRQVIDTDPNLIFVKDTSGICVLANRALAEHYGLTAQEMIGKHPLEFNPNREEALAHIEADRRVIESGKEMLAILPSVRRNGQQCWFLTIKKPLILPDGSVNVLGIAVDITEQKRAEIKLAESYQELQRLSSHLENLREDERAKIARDLHDEMGSLLVALKMRVAWLASQLSGEKPLLKEEAGHISELVADAIRSVHQTVAELRPNLQEGFGFAATVEDYVNKFQQRTGIKCKLSLPAGELDLDANKSVTLFRILQESLNNIVKHAQASQVKIRFAEKDGSLSLLIEDNGVGFDPAVQKKESFGLLGIRERAMMMGGETRISSAPGKGTRVAVTFTPHESAGLT